MHAPVGSNLRGMTARLTSLGSCINVLRHACRASVVTGGLSLMAVLASWQHGLTPLVAVLVLLGIVLGGLLLDGWCLTRHIARTLHMRRRQAAVLTRMAHSLATEPVLDTFLGQVLTAAAEQLQTDGAALWFHDRARDTLVMYMTVEKGRILVAGQAGTTVPRPHAARDVPLWQELVRSRQPIFIADVAREPRLLLRQALLAQGVRTLLLVPLLRDDEVMGWMSVRSTTPRQYHAEEFELAQTLSQHVMLAVQLSCVTEQQRQAAVLEERHRLAREIHDTLAQSLTGMVVQLDVAEEALLETSDKARAHLVRARQLAYESLIEARWSVQALRPRALVDHDLPTALTRLVEQVTAQTPVQARVQIHGTPCLLSPTVENALLRISQEALTNTVKHAQARTAHLALTFDTAEVSLRVSDDGHGFDPYQAAPQHGFGLISMRERAEHIGGHLTLTSQPSHGTAIRVVVPMVQGHRQGGLDEYRQSDSYSDCRRSPCGA